MQEVKLFAVDLDGTFLDPNHRLTDRNAEAYRAAQEVATCMIATGRNRKSALLVIGEEQMKKANLKTYPGIFMNGGIVYGPDGPEHVLLERSLPLGFVKMLEDEVAAYKSKHGCDFSVVACRQDRLYVAEFTKHWEDFATKWSEPKAEVVGPLAKYLMAGESRFFGKVTLVAEEEDIREMYDKLLPKLKEKFELDAVSPLPCLMDIMPAGMNKADGLRVLMNHMGLTNEQLMTMGDNNNDREMLKIPGAVTVAMGNGLDCVKEVARFIAPTNGEDGVAAALDEHVLRNHLKAA